MVARPAVGTRVRFNARFLLSIGEIRNSETGLRKWTVMACDCVLCQPDTGNHVAVDEKSIYDGQRHLAFANLELTK